MKIMKQEQQEQYPPRKDAGLRWRSLVIGLCLSLALTTPCFADDLKTIEVTIKDHKFWPSEIHVKAGEATILDLKNKDATPEEFDSSALKVEKVVIGGGAAKVRLRPLGPGKYPFTGEYHSDTAQGVVIAE
jgi:cupredoxin-like protein